MRESPFILPSGRGIRILLFGDEGSGKTDLAAGVTRMTNRYLYIDNEGSTTAYPMHHYSESEPYGLVMLSPKESGRVRSILERELGNVAVGKAQWDAIVLDGLTEHQVVRSQGIATQRHKDDPKEDPSVLSMRGWGLLLDDLLRTAQLMVELSNHGTAVILTAAAETEGGEIRPLCQGAFGKLVGRYFDLSVYVKGEPDSGGKPVHMYHLLKSGLFKGKNRWEDVWLKTPKKYPPKLVNAKLELLLHLVQEAAKEKAVE